MHYMDSTIEKDLYRYDRLTGKRGFFRGLLIPGFRYTFLLRMVSKHYNHPIRKFMFSLLKRRYSYKFGYQIPAETKIGDGLFIGHFGAVIISKDAIIGNNCNISPGVTIGQANRGWIKGAPTLGDRVWIGTNSVIIGKITIGSNVLIAPNSTVNFDVPDNSMVRGNPAKIASSENAVEGYIVDILE